MFDGALSGVVAAPVTRVEVHDCTVRNRKVGGARACGAGAQMLLTGGSIENYGDVGIVAKNEGQVEASNVHVKGLPVAFEAITGHACTYLCVSAQPLSLQTMEIGCSLKNAALMTGRCLHYQVRLEKP